MGVQISSFSQYQYCKNISVDDGLPSNAIMDIHKDSRGYLWIATRGGLVKYNGNEFKTYTTVDGLVGNNVWSVTEDTLGNIWAACYGKGISCFDGKHFTNYSTTDGLVNDNVRIIEYSERFKGLLIGTVFGFSFYKDSTFVNFVDSTVTSRDLLQVISFLETDSLIYLFTYRDNDQFIKFNPLKKKFSYLDKSHRFHYNSNRSTCSFITSKGDTILGDYIFGIKQYTKDTVILNHEVGQVFSISEDNDSVLWLASWNSGYLIAKDDKGGICKIEKGITTHMNGMLGIESEKAWHVYYDSIDNIFLFGTWDKGIYQTTNRNLQYTPSSKLNNKAPIIYDIFIDSKGSKLLTVGGGLLIINSDTIVIDKESFIRSIPPKMRESIPNWKKNGKDFQLFLINKDDSGKIWISSNLGTFMLDNMAISYYTGHTSPCEIFAVSDSTISYLSFFQLFNHSLKSGIVQSVLKIRKNATYSSYCKHIEVNGTTFIYNNTDGIIRYDNGTIYRYDYLNNTIETTFNSICKDRDGNLIAGTLNGDLYRLKYERDSIIFLNELGFDKSIYGSKISWVIADQSNRIWAGTNKGMIVFEKGKLERFFNAENGFFDLETHKAIQSSDGKIHVISNNNIFEFDPNLLLNKIPTHKLEINRIDINYQPFNWEEYLIGDNWDDIPKEGFKLPFEKNTLTFYFNLLQFNESNCNQYSYKLFGMKDEWSPFSSESKAVFTHLKHGKYILKIRGRLITSPKIISETSYSFVIRPPWYGSWWFYSGLSIIIVGLIYTVHKIRVSNIRKEAAIDQRLAELRMEALQAQMNPHFIFNSFNSFQLDILKNDKNSALTYVQDFASLMRKTLDNSVMKLIPLADELEYLNLYMELEKSRYEELKFRFEIDKDISPEYIHIPPMLIQPIIENSLLHGIRHLPNGGQLLLKFQKWEETNLKVSISDNGIGRKGSEKVYKKQGRTYISHSSRIINERIKLLKLNPDFQKISLKYIDLQNGNNASGTLVELIIPV